MVKVTLDQTTTREILGALSRSHTCALASGNQELANTLSKTHHELRAAYDAAPRQAAMDELNTLIAWPHDLAANGKLIGPKISSIAIWALRMLLGHDYTVDALILSLEGDGWQGRGVSDETRDAANIVARRLAVCVGAA